MPKEQRFMFIAIGAAFLLLFVFWSIGFFANGLFGYHFEINSAWQGFVTLSGAGVLNMGRYFVDSWKNSEQGVMPSETGRVGRIIHDDTDSKNEAGRTSN